MWVVDGGSSPIHELLLNAIAGRRPSNTLYSSRETQPGGPRMGQELYIDIATGWTALAVRYLRLRSR